jgi:inosose dehydratase
MGMSPGDGSIAMTSQIRQRVWNRREVLAAAGALAGTCGLAKLAHTEDSVRDVQDGDFSPFKLGLQSYSLRGLTKNGRPDRAKALAASKELGIRYWESYVAHVPMNVGPEPVEAMKQEIEAAGVSVIAYGVVLSGRIPTPTAR